MASEGTIKKQYQHLRFHPRLVEIEVAMLSYNLGMSYSIDGIPNDNASKMFMQTLCAISSIPFEKILTIISNQYRILRDGKSRGDEETRIRFRQQVIFLGILKGESRELVAKKYLRLTKQTLYNEPRLKPENFVTADWIAELDDYILLGGDKPLVNAAIELLKQMDKLREAIGYVSIPKAEV